MGRVSHVSLLLFHTCFHSIGCPSEWGATSTRPQNTHGKVSIQLVAPASGAVGLALQKWLFIRFHSIGCPSEWGACLIQLHGRFIEFPFNWLPQRVGRSKPCHYKRMSTAFPFNWLPQRVGRDELALFHPGQMRVSIQLVAPASGATEKVTPPMALSQRRFHSIGCPSEWGGIIVNPGDD